MRRLAFLGLLMLLGAIGGVIVVSGHYLLGAFMGIVIGSTIAVVVLAFPRNNGEVSDDDDGFPD